MGKLKKYWVISVTICLSTALSACSYTTQSEPETARFTDDSSKSTLQSPRNVSGTNNSDEPSVSPRMKIAYSEVTSAYEDAGMIAPTRAELDDVSIQICENIETGGDGMYHHVSLVRDATDELFAQALNYAFATATNCLPKGNFALGQSMSSALSKALDGSSFDYIGVLEDREKELENKEKELEDPLISTNPNGTYEIDYSQLYLPNYGGNSSPSGGYPVICSDGSMSSSGGKQGACSWHGGLD